MTRLNQRQKLVVKILEQNTKPMTAYELLAALQPFGVNAPIMVYRALKTLIHNGLVHRIESQNTYVACQHQHHEIMSLFLICKNCGYYEEIIEEEWQENLHHLTKLKKFSHHQENIEIIGLCEKCKR